MVQLGTRLGVVKTEPESPESRAYLRAHRALHWLRNYLIGCQLRQVGDSQIELIQAGQVHLIRLEGSQLVADRQLEGEAPVGELVYQPQRLQSVELGPSGGVRFRYHRGGLEVDLRACDESLGSLGQYRSQIRFPLTWSDAAEPLDTDRAT